MTEADDQATPRKQAGKKASLVFILVFALAAYAAIRAPDYSHLPVPRPHAPPLPGHPLTGHPLTGHPGPGQPAAEQPAAEQAAALPGNMPARAADALKTARQWRPDAALVQIEVKKDLSFLPAFTFLSAADNMRLDVTGEGRTVTTTASPAGPKTPAQPIVLRFIDLPAAAGFARTQGMAGEVRSATLSVTGPDRQPVWTLQTETDKYPYYIDAVTGLPASRPAP
jgi:hypothetical protein